MSSALIGQALMAPWVDVAAREGIHRLAADAIELTDAMNAVTVVDTSAAARVTELLALAGSVQRRVEEARRQITDPLKRQAKDIEDAVRPLMAALETLIHAGKAKVITWQRAERERVEAERRERERQEAEAITAARAKAAETGAPVAVANVPPPVAEAPRGIKTDYGTASIRKTWDFEIVDASAVPRAFLQVNEQAIRAAVRAGSRQIDGVRIFERDGLSVTAAR